jgi:hypothetical protein
MPKEQTRSVNLPLELHTELKIVAAKKEVYLRDLIIEVLRQYLEDGENGK